MRRLVVGVLAGLLLAACGQRPVDSGQVGPAPVTTAPVSTSEVTVPPGLGPRAEDVLAQARRSGVATVGLTIATEPGRTDEVAERVRALGATVEATDATIGYVRVSTPVDLVERVAAADGVSRVDVDEPLGNGDPEP